MNEWTVTDEDKRTSLSSHLVWMLKLFAPSKLHLDVTKLTKPAVMMKDAAQAALAGINSLLISFFAATLQ